MELPFLLIDGVLHFENDKNMKKAILENPNKHVETINLLIYTPSIKTGVSFKTHRSHQFYGIACRLSSSAREFHQEFFRVRNISTRKYNVFLGNTSIGTLQNGSSNTTITMEQQAIRKAAYNDFCASIKNRKGDLPFLSKHQKLEESNRKKWDDEINNMKHKMHFVQHQFTKPIWYGCGSFSVCKPKIKAKIHA